jgi:protein subunit release factor B
MQRELIYSLSRKNFKIETFRGSGPGGQKRNKTDSGVRITHPESGAIGRATEDRSQYKNKKVAFQRMVDSKEFQIWHKMKIGAIIQDEQILKERVERRVDEWMKPENILVEYVGSVEEN